VHVSVVLSADSDSVKLGMNIMPMETSLYSYILLYLRDTNMTAVRIHNGGITLAPSFLRRYRFSAQGPNGPCCHKALKNIKFYQKKRK